MLTFFKGKLFIPSGGLMLKSLRRRMYQFVIPWLPYAVVEDKYVKSGVRVATLIQRHESYVSTVFRKPLEDWEIWEKEFARRGFRTLAMRELIRFRPLDFHLGLAPRIGVKRRPGEDAILYAKLYREQMETIQASPFVQHRR